MSEEAPESTRKKRKADHPADEGELGPSRKASKHESEDASQELVASQESPSQAKRPWRSVKEARRTHKERVAEALKAACYACLHLASHLDAETKKSDLDFSLLAVLAKDLVTPLEEAEIVFSEDAMTSVLEGLKRRAVATIEIGFFSLGDLADKAGILLHHDMLESSMNRGLTIQDPSKSEILALDIVRGLFIMIIERATSPETLHTFLTQSSSNPDDDASNQECSGITSNSILNGFKAFANNVKKDADVALEDSQLPDGSIISILRSADCLGRKMRGQMCNNCRAAQNRWAVRLCRYKKAANTPVDSAL